MIQSTTIRQIESYMEEASAPTFLAGFFKSPARNFHTSEKVSLDIERDEEDVAIVVQSISSGARKNESSLYVNKGFTPPVFDEEGAISVYDTIKRQAGDNPFEDPNFVENARNTARSIFRKLEKKIRRAVELMASQVLQSGVLTLTDSAGTALYSLDFQPKSTHIETVGTTWAADGATGNPLGDLDALSIVVRRDGKTIPDTLIFGAVAWQRFISNADVKAKLDNRRMELGLIEHKPHESGASYRGEISIGHYRFKLWTYEGFYKNPTDGVLTPYVHDEKVIMLSSKGRLDLTFGAIPQIKRPDPSAAMFLPARMSSVDLGLDLSTNAWFTPNGKNLMVSCGTRPLTIPTAIDTFACLDITT